MLKATICCKHALRRCSAFSERLRGCTVWAATSSWATVVDTDEAGFRSLVERLQKAFDEVPSCEVAIGAQWDAAIE